MASHRRPKPASRTRVTVLTVTAAATVALTSQAAQAAPAKQSVKDVKAQVDKLYEDAEVATEKLNGAKEKQEELQKQVDNLQDDVAGQQDELNELTSELGALASAQYRDGGVDPSLQLFLSADPDDFLDKASTLDQLTAKQAEAIQQVQDVKRTLNQQRSEATTKLAELDETRTELAKQKKAVQSKLAKARALLNTLTQAQQDALDAAQERANRSAGSRVELGSDTSATGRAAVALAAAQAKIGTPYVYGATGPGSYDCSGLTSWAYAQADVVIPRTSQAQSSAGTRLSINQLQPGDLVIFYDDLHHVGLYAGNGQVLHAPRTGTVVRYEAMSNMPFMFGVRI